MEAKLDRNKLEKMCRALGDPYRIQMMEAIKQEEGWMPCTVLVEMFQLAQSTVSHHLKQLVEADLLFSEKDGRCTHYKINKEAFGEYVGYLKNFGK